MMRTRCRSAAIVLFILMTLTACESGGLNEQDVAGDWLLVEGTVNGAEFPLLGDHPVTLALGADGTVSGTSACNSYSGTFDLVHGVMVVGDEIAATAMGCAPEVARIESMYLETLPLLTTARLEGAELILSGGTRTLRFDRTGS